VVTALRDETACAREPSSGAGPPRQALHRRAPVPKHERRSRAGIFHGWDGRRHHHRASRFKSLFVITRNSCFTYKHKAVDIKQVGRELGVRYVLEGSVRKAGGKVRITGQFIEAGTGAHLWADRFDGPLDDIFALRDSVTSSVAAAIAPRLEQAEIDRSERKPTESLEVIDLYDRAIHAHRRVTRHGYEDALRLARQAISLDPNLAGAYGLILDCFVRQRDQGWITNDAAATEGKQYALRAIEVGADDAFALACE
jgi:hypothetical protein